MENFKRRVFYISGKKIVRDTNLVSGVPFNQTQHTEEDDIVVYATINLNLKPEYQMFMHLYEHLLFNNLEIDGVVYKNVSEIFGYMSKHGICLNANTGSSGINIILTIPNTAVFNKRMQKSKGFRPFSWVKDEEITEKVAIASKVLKAILFDRPLITREVLEKEAEVIKSEMQTVCSNQISVLTDCYKVLTKNLGPVLGEPADFDRVGMDKVFDLVRTLDKHKADPEFIEFGIDYDMNIYGDPEFEDVPMADYVRELTNLPISKYVDEEVNTDLEVYRDVIEYKDEVTENEMEASGSRVLLLTAAIDADKFKFNDDPIQNKMDVGFAKQKLIFILTDIAHGLLHYIREVKQACYNVMPVTLSIPENTKVTLENGDKDIHINLAFPLQSKVDIDELAKDVEDYIQNVFEINDSMIEDLKRNSIIMFTTFDRRDVRWTSIRAVNFIIDHTVKTGEIDEKELIERIADDFEQDPNRINKEQILQIFDEFKKNLKIVKIK